MIWSFKKNPLKLWFKEHSIALCTLILTLIINGCTYFDSHIKSFDPELYFSSPIFYNHQYKEGKLNYQDVAIILPIIFYNNTAQSGLIEDIVITLEDTTTGSTYAYLPYMNVDRAIPNTKMFSLKGIKNGFRRTVLGESGNHSDIFNPIHLKPYERRIEYIFFLQPDYGEDINMSLTGEYKIDAHILYGKRTRDFNIGTEKIALEEMKAYFANIENARMTKFRKELVDKLISKQKTKFQ